MTALACVFARSAAAISTAVGATSALCIAIAAARSASLAPLSVSVAPPAPPRRPNPPRRPPPRAGGGAIESMRALAADPSASDDASDRA